ncbi:hypothetical conserved protein [Oceanobacillus iheyensis HTE831]|uniref:Hypothetical conserved protein n=1 Tax=Oceanobacillus iheyensis (strain DSM 14371 / CIP 107618 / JCM 11309 / KCTC 3954 / HTE831) TaxID=221109 RepID=Q8EQV6_OCEIH|nr:FapA family protein [Oceanobacillus iheyensis]BAC13539.1 hypothetical conserved protein [Oceanobacillus iheyensis HTE831]
MKVDNPWRIYTSKDKMAAYIEIEKEAFLEEDAVLIHESIEKQLHDQGIVHGIKDSKLTSIDLSVNEPILIAEGKKPINGEDGRLEILANLDTSINRRDHWDYREVMRIPNVTKGQLLAKLILPKQGIDGLDVTGRVLKAKDGKPKKVRAGKNVVWKEDVHSFFAASDGQISINNQQIQVLPVFKVNESISMKTGNLDFVGNIEIHGDVPSGFEMKAEGDIRIHGVVEGAKIIAGGSVFIMEGIAGKNIGSIQAGNDIILGYCNHSFIQAGNDLYVEKSILHSDCTVIGHVYCKLGNIIGGSVSAGKTMEAKDIGNRLGIKTEIAFGINKNEYEKEKQLIYQKNKLEEDAKKIKSLGQRLRNGSAENNQKLRLSLLRQRNLLKQTEEEIHLIDQSLLVIQSTIGSEHEASLIVRNFIHPNVIISFGKYKRIIKSAHHFVKIKVSKNEIDIIPLFE